MAVFFPMMLCNIFFTPLGLLFPLLIRVHYGGSAWHNSIAEFFIAGGLLFSSLIISIWGGMKRRFYMVSLAIGLLGGSCIISGVTPSSQFWLFVVCCFLMGSSGTFINVPLMAYTQETIPPEMMGKVCSFLMTGMTWAMPIGLMVSGPVSELIGIDRWFFWSGVALLTTAIFCRMLTRKYDTQTMRPE